jgi:hypothetical protein
MFVYLSVIHFHYEVFRVFAGSIIHRSTIEEALGEGAQVHKPSPEI